MIGFDASPAKYGYLLLVLVLVSNVGSGMGFILGTLAPDSNVGKIIFDFDTRCHYYRLRKK